MYRRTPIRIKQGRVYVWLRRGKVTHHSVPAFMLALQASKRKGDTVLSYPYSPGDHVTMGWEPTRS